MPMSPSTEDVYRAALALPEAERLALAEALLASQGRPGGLPFDPAWLDEARRRSAEIDAGEVVAAPWAEVRERVRRRVEGSASGSAAASKADPVAEISIHTGSA